MLCYFVLLCIYYCYLSQRDKKEPPGSSLFFLLCFVKATRNSSHHHGLRLYRHTQSYLSILGFHNNLWQLLRLVILSLFYSWIEGYTSHLMVNQNSKLKFILPPKPILCLDIFSHSNFIKQQNKITKKLVGFILHIQVSPFVINNGPASILTLVCLVEGSLPHILRRNSS